MALRFKPWVFEGIKSMTRCHSYDALASHLEVSPSTLQRVRSGAAAPNEHLICRVSNLLGTNDLGQFLEVR